MTFTLTWTQRWFIVETLHFIVGFICFEFMPTFGMNQYTLNPDVAPNEKAFEMTQVVNSYYQGYVVIAFFSILNLNTAIAFATALIVFYGRLTIYDARDLMTVGYHDNPIRYLDTAIHVAFGLVSLYIVCYHLFSRKAMIERETMKGCKLMKDKHHVV